MNDPSGQTKRQPPRPGRGHRLADLIGDAVALVRRHPGDWHIVRSYTSASGAIQALPSARKAFPDVTFEAHRAPARHVGLDQTVASELWATVPKPTPPEEETNP